MKIIKIIGVVVFLVILLRACNCSDTPKSDSIKTDQNKQEENPQPPQKPDLEITKQTGTSDGNGYVKVFATVKNNSTSLKSYVQIDVVVYDKKENVIGTGIGNTSNLPAGASRVITCYVSDIYAENWAYTTEISANSY